MKLSQKQKFILAIIGAVAAFFAGSFTLNFYQIINNNSTLTDSPIFQNVGSAAVNYTKVEPSNIPNDQFFVGTIHFLNDKPWFSDGVNATYNNVVFIMPDDTKAYIKKIPFGSDYEIGRCNEAKTHCFIYNSFKIPIADGDVCWVITTRFGHDFNTDITVRNPNTLTSGLCYTPVS